MTNAFILLQVKNTGITFEVARQYCETQIKASSSYTDCADILGIQTDVYIGFCVRDYMVRLDFVSLCGEVGFCVGDGGEVGFFLLDSSASSVPE